MLPRILEQIELRHLQELITNEEQEGKYIEYKSRSYRLDADDQKGKS